MMSTLGVGLGPADDGAPLARAVGLATGLGLDVGGGGLAVGGCVDPTLAWALAGVAWLAAGLLDGRASDEGTGVTPGKDEGAPVPAHDAMSATTATPVLARIHRRGIVPLASVRPAATGALIDKLDGQYPATSSQ
jgi:hypothetical protein